MNLPFGRDHELKSSVRSAAEKLVSHPWAIAVAARSGRVTLEGPILTTEASRLLSAVSGMKGVREISNRLDIYSEPHEAPGFRANRAAAMNQRIRTIAIVAGALAIGYLSTRIFKKALCG